jgi:cobalt-zinc-cadmium efflux system outer membrane protein
VGNPGVPAGGVAGGLDTGLPQVSEQGALDSILKDSPAIKIAQAGLARAEAMVKRASIETIPDIELKGGLQQNSESLGRGKVGLQGFAELGVELHIFDRNQGNVQAARAEVERARHELQRVDLALRDQTSSMYRKSCSRSLRYGNSATRAKGVRTHPETLWADIWPRLHPC